MNIILFALIGLVVIGLIFAIIKSALNRKKNAGGKGIAVDKDKLLEEISIKIDILINDSPYVSQNRINFSSSDVLERRLKKVSQGHIPTPANNDASMRVETFNELSSKAEKLFIDEDFIHALIYYREAEKFLPKDEFIRKQTYLFMGSIYYNLGVFDRALVHLKKADIDNNYDYDLLILLLASTLRLGLWKRANIYLSRFFLAGNDNYQLKRIHTLLTILIK